MVEQIVGLTALQRRLHAIGGPDTSNERMQFIATIVVGQMKLNIPHKTSHTSRTLHVASVTPTTAKIDGSEVAKWIDEGTGLFGPKHHKITPTTAKAMRWTGGPAGSLRLTGQARKGKAGKAAFAIFARSTKGMKPRPYIDRSIATASQKLGVELERQIVKEWNDAA